MLTPRSPFVKVCRITRAAFAALVANTAAPTVVVERDPGEYWDAITALGVDPLLVLAMFLRESGMGRAGTATISKSWGNTRAPTFGAVPIGTTTGHGGSYPVFASWLDGCKSTAARLASTSYPAKAPYALRDLGGIFAHPSGLVWAPAGDMNNPASYLRGVLDYMNKWEGFIGPGLSCPAMSVNLTTVNTFEPGKWPGRAACPIRCQVIHVQAGTQAGSIEWAHKAKAKASANFYYDKAGAVVMVVNPNVQAPWANGIPRPERAQLPPSLRDLAAPDAPNANWFTVSHELEGFPHDPGFPTEAQYRSLASVMAWVCNDSGLVPGPETIGRHSWFDPVDRPECPGPQVDTERVIKDVAALLLAANSPAAPPPPVDGDALLDAAWQADRDRLGPKVRAGHIARPWGGQKVLICERGALTFDGQAVSDITGRLIDGYMAYARADGSLALF